MMNESLKWLQRWYWRHCDGDWEHSYGVTIDSMDTPGWSLTINLQDTPLQDRTFDAQSVHRGKYDWLECSVEDGSFSGYCSPNNLEELIDVFASWADASHEIPDIFAAIEHADIEAIKDIITRSPEHLERIDGDWAGYPPLYVAVASGQVEIAELLLESNADVNRRNAETGWSPIFPATSDVVMVSLLLRHGAAASAVDAKGRTPLHFAVGENQGIDSQSIVDLLLEYGADPNATDEGGDTPLHVAILHNRADIARHLIRSGADPSLPNAHAITPAQMASEHGIDLGY